MWKLLPMQDFILHLTQLGKIQLKNIWRSIRLPLNSSDNYLQKNQVNNWFEPQF